MLGEWLGYSSDLFEKSSFLDEVPLNFMSGCAEPTCETRCYNCKSGCNSGITGRDPIEPV